MVTRDNNEASPKQTSGRREAKRSNDDAEGELGEEVDSDNRRRRQQRHERKIGNESEVRPSARQGGKREKCSERRCCEG